MPQPRGGKKAKGNDPGQAKMTSFYTARPQPGDPDDDFESDTPQPRAQQAGARRGAAAAGAKRERPASDARSGPASREGATSKPAPKRAAAAPAGPPPDETKVPPPGWTVERQLRQDGSRADKYFVHFRTKVKVKSLPAAWREHRRARALPDGAPPSPSRSKAAAAGSSSLGGGGGGGSCGGAAAAAERGAAPGAKLKLSQESGAAGRASKAAPRRRALGGSDDDEDDDDDDDACDDADDEARQTIALRKAQARRVLTKHSEYKRKRVAYADHLPGGVEHYAMTYGDGSRESRAVLFPLDSADRLLEAVRNAHLGGDVPRGHRLWERKLADEDLGWMNNYSDFLDSFESAIDEAMGVLDDWIQIVTADGNFLADLTGALEAAQGAGEPHSAGVSHAPASVAAAPAAAPAAAAARREERGPRGTSDDASDDAAGGADGSAGGHGGAGGAGGSADGAGRDWDEHSSRAPATQEGGAPEQPPPQPMAAEPPQSPELTLSAELSGARSGACAEPPPWQRPQPGAPWSSAQHGVDEPAVSADAPAHPASHAPHEIAISADAPAEANEIAISAADPMDASAGEAEPDAAAAAAAHAAIHTAAAHAALAVADADDADSASARLSGEAGTQASDAGTAVPSPAAEGCEGGSAPHSGRVCSGKVAADAAGTAEGGRCTGEAVAGPEPEAAWAARRVPTF